MHPRFLLLPLVLAGSLALAQTSGPIVPQPAPTGPEPLQNKEQLDGRRNQKIERIQHEDAGSRVEELRVGGQTQSITVQPKADVPEYGISATDLARSRPADHRDGMSNATGQRFWNVLKF
jgi:hypothetical protein